MATKSAAAATVTPDIPYTPDAWNAAQRAMHRAQSLEVAFHHASCLAGGWYGRAVSIDYQVTAANTERYMLRPSEVPAKARWTPVYEVKAVHA